MTQRSATRPVLTYFPLPGRAEVARLLFTIGKVDFEDRRITQADWPALKPNTPFGQIPQLQVGDVQVAQSAAIDHYAAKVAGLLPEDPVKALLADQAYFFVLLDIHNALIAPINRLSDPDAQVKARQELVRGALVDKLTQLSRLVEKRAGKFIAGDQVSHGDLAIFAHLSNLRSGLWTGIPNDILDSYPTLKAFRNQIATIPEVQAYYANAKDDVRQIGYTPDQ